MRFEMAASHAVRGFHGVNVSPPRGGSGRKVDSMGLLRDPRLETLLDRLHAQSAGQGEALASYFTARAREGSID